MAFHAIASLRITRGSYALALDDTKGARLTGHEVCPRFGKRHNHVVVCFTAAVAHALFGRWQFHVIGAIHFR